jgi:hypothetical protein
MKSAAEEESLRMIELIVVLEKTRVKPNNLCYTDPADFDSAEKLKGAQRWTPKYLYAFDRTARRAGRPGRG